MESKVDTFTLTFTKGQEEMEAKVGKPLALNLHPVNVRFGMQGSVDE